MLQQLFNVPAFRYSLLAADDREAPNIVADKGGKELDDNLLHQLVRLFSFLQMTDRQEYSPVDFCFAFKEPGGNPTNVRVQQDAQEFINFGFGLAHGLDHEHPAVNTSEEGNNAATIGKDRDLNWIVGILSIR